MRAVFQFCPFFIFISPSPLLCSCVLRCPGQLSGPLPLCYVTYLLILLFFCYPPFNAQFSSFSLSHMFFHPLPLFPISFPSFHFWVCFLVQIWASLNAARSYMLFWLRSLLSAGWLFCRPSLVISCPLQLLTSYLILSYHLDLLIHCFFLQH